MQSRGPRESCKEQSESLGNNPVGLEGLCTAERAALCLVYLSVLPWLQPQKVLCLTMKGKGKLQLGDVSALALEFIVGCLQQVELLSTPAHYKVWREGSEKFPSILEGLIMSLNCVMCRCPDPGHLPACTFTFAGCTRRKSCGGMSLVGVSG